MSVVQFRGEARALRGDIRLDGEDVDVIVGPGLVAFDEELAVANVSSGASGASPIVRLRVFDPQHRLVRSGILEVRPNDDDRLRREVELVVDGVVYWLRNIAKRRDFYELTFEDRTVALLRVRRGVMRVRTGTMGHRRLIERLCERAGVPAPITHDPTADELAARRRAGIGNTVLRTRRDRRARDERREPGLPDGARVTVKDRAADAEQISNMNVALTEALRHNPTALALETMVAAITVESTWRNVQGRGADHVSWGLVQNIPGRSVGVNGVMTRAQALDIPYTIRSVLLPPGPTSKGGLIKVSREHPDLDHGTLADICINGVGVGDPKYVDKVNGRVEEARRIIRAFGGGDGLSSGSPAALVRTVESPLTVERGETDWDAAVRIADSYGFRFFVVANQPYYFADRELMRSRPRMILSERSPGVDWIDWEWAPHRQLRRTDLECRALAWQAPPGSVVLLDESNGPAGASDEDPDRGRWLVAAYESSRFEDSARITLIKGRKVRVPTERRQEAIAGSEDSSPPVGVDGYHWPLGARGTIIGTPYAGTHSLGNWQSDNALDIGVPNGTAVMAVATGRVEKVSGSYSGGASRFDGIQVTLRTKGNRWFYTHLATAVVKRGDRVEAGQVIGTSGSANGVPHLHLGVERGDPRRLLGITR